MPDLSPCYGVDGEGDLSLVESVSVASIAYAASSAIYMMLLVVCVEVFFFGWARMYEVVVDWMCVVLSSRIEDRNASPVVFACCRASCRYPLVYLGFVSLMFGSGNWSGD